FLIDGFVYDDRMYQRSPLFPCTTLFRSGSRDRLASAQAIEGDQMTRPAIPFGDGIEEAAVGAPGRTVDVFVKRGAGEVAQVATLDRKSTRLNSSHVKISYAVFCLKKKKN